MRERSEQNVDVMSARGPCHHGKPRAIAGSCPRLGPGPGDAGDPWTTRPGLQGCTYTWILFQNVQDRTVNESSLAYDFLSHVSCGFPTVRNTYSDDKRAGGPFMALVNSRLPGRPHDPRFCQNPRRVSKAPRSLSRGSSVAPRHAPCTGCARVSGARPSVRAPVAARSAWRREAEASP